jgi:excisionase family DNA binding protein
MQPLKSVEQAAGLLGLSTWTVRAYIRDGKLRPVRLGRRVLLAENELERLVAESQEQNDPDDPNQAGSATVEATR